MLNDNEKRKGLPRISALAYLIGGILIGSFGVLAVMFFLTMPACACSPMPTPTITLPYIPTPNPGATGTASGSACAGSRWPQQGQQLSLARSLLAGVDAY